MPSAGAASDGKAAPAPLGFPTATGPAVRPVPADALVVSVTAAGFSPDVRSLEAAVAGGQIGAAFEVGPGVDYGALAEAMESASGAGLSGFYIIVDDGGVRGGVSVVIRRKMSPQDAPGPGDLFCPDRRPASDLGMQITAVGEVSDETETRLEVRMPTTGNDDLSVTPQKVMKRIRSVYIKGLHECHQDGLDKDPSAGGEVRLEFTVGKSGGVTKTRATGFDGDVSACIEKRALAWDFGIPKGEYGPTEATFSIVFVFTPGARTSGDETGDKTVPVPPALAESKIADPCLVVLGDETTLIVFSLTGQAGSMQQPLLELRPTAGSFDLTKLTAAVTGVSHHDALLPIMLSLGDRLPVQIVVDVITAVTHSSDGRQIFGDPTLTHSLLQ